MQELKHILFPVDLSKACSLFAPIVRFVARRTGARVSLLNTLALPPSYLSNPNAFLGLVDIRSWMRRQRADFNKFLQVDLASLAEVTRVSRHGDPARTIVDYARKRKIDLIMLPTYGVGPFRRLLIGSVTAKVLHDATCPVWTSAHAPELPQPERLSKVLCALDLSDKSVAVMQYAQWLATMFGAQLRFLNVVAVSEAWEVHYFESEFVATLVDRAREQIRHLQDRAGTKAEADVMTGEIARSVRREALEWCADLIVVGRRVLGETLGRLRNETYGIIRESPCPVLSV